MSKIQNFKTKIDCPTILLLLLLLSALLLRVYNLSGESLWLDEGTSIRRSKLNLIEIVPELITNVHPPLYFFILKYWLLIFGDSEFSVRFPSVIFGLCSIFMIYKLGSAIFNRTTGLISTLILCFSVFHVQYSQEARGYSLMVLLSIISMYTLIKLIEDKEKEKIHRAGYIISSILLIYTHSYGLLIILAQNIFLITTYIISKNSLKLDFRKWISLQGIIALLYVPWLFILTFQVISIQSGYWISQPDIKIIYKTFLNYAGSKNLLFTFLLILIVSIFFLIKSKISNIPVLYKPVLYKEVNGYTSDFREGHKMLLLISWLLVPVAVPFLVSQILAPIYQIRYTISASVAFYILIALAIEKIKIKYVKAFFIFSIIIFSMCNLYKYYVEINKQQWRDSVKYVEMNAQSGDIILCVPHYTLNSVINYYSKRYDLYKLPVKMKSKKLDDEEKEKLDDEIKKYKKFWLIISCDKDYLDFEQHFKSMSYSIRDKKIFDGNGSIYGWHVIRLYLFEKADLINLTKK